MPEAPPAFLADLSARAEAAGAAEVDYRRAARDRMAALEAARVAAYRRLDLVRRMAAAAAPDPAVPAGPTAAVASVRDGLGWAELTPAREDILQALQPVADAIAAGLRGEVVEPGVAEAVQAFEAWYVGVHGVAFAALFDRYMPETPVVDF